MTAEAIEVPDSWYVKKHKLHLRTKDGGRRQVGFDCAHRRAGMGACAGCYARLLVLLEIAGHFLKGECERMRFKACFDEAQNARQQEDAVLRLTGKRPR